jgi:hypothetical protein
VAVLWLSNPREKSERKYGLWRDGSLGIMNEVEGGRRAYYKEEELEIVKWENKYSLETKV